MKGTLRRCLPPGLVRRLRYLNRLRWFTKLRLLHASGGRVSDAPLQGLRYVLWDPEVESFSYEIDNRDELEAFIAELFELPAPEVAGYLAEVDADPELNERLWARMRWRLDVKTRLPLGNRMLWYGLARALKPRLIVETGIYQGLGSLVLLRALARNATEGHEGELISIDADPHAGVVVGDAPQPRWRKVVGLTGEVLEEAVAGRQVDMLIQDTPHTYENQCHEFGVAIAHAAPRLVLLDSSGGSTPALRQACERRKASLALFRDRPRGHFYTHPGTQVGVIAAAGAARGEAARARAAP